MGSVGSQVPGVDIILREVASQSFYFDVIMLLLLSLNNIHISMSFSSEISLMPSVQKHSEYWSSLSYLTSYDQFDFM